VPGLPWHMVVEGAAPAEGLAVHDVPSARASAAGKRDRGAGATARYRPLSGRRATLIRAKGG
jgi:hypothetical protein